MKNQLFHCLAASLHKVIFQGVREILRRNVNTFDLTDCVTGCMYTIDCGQKFLVYLCLKWPPRKSPLQKRVAPQTMRATNAQSAKEALTKIRGRLIHYSENARGVKPAESYV